MTATTARVRVPDASSMSTLSRHVSAPRGAALSCKGWPQEAALRMLMNNLDPEVAERPDDLVVYGGSGRAARSWAAFDAIVATLRRSSTTKRCVVQSGKPVGVFRTHPWAPRVLIANALLVPAWATWDTFRDLEDRGLTMYGQMTAGSWIYIGTQGILQGTYETLAELARRHFGGSLTGRLVVTAGLGGMGGAQPLAVTMNGGVALVVEVDPPSASSGGWPRATSTSAPDRSTRRWRASTRCRAATARRDRSRSRPTPPTSCPSWSRRGVVPDVVTDQTSAHDALNGYVPNGLSLAEADAAAPHAIRTRTCDRVDGSDGDPRARDAGAASARRGDVRLRQQHPRAGRRRPASPTRSTFPASCPNTSGRSSARARGRSAGRRSRAIRRTSRRPIALALEMFADDERARADGFAWRASASRSRDCRRASSGSDTASARGSASRINDLVRRGVVKAPIVIGRDHLDTGSVASPNRETEGMRDGSDAIADWPVLNALLNTSCGRDVGVGASRRRRRDRLLAARRHGRRRRRHARGGREAAARADLRSRASASSGTRTPAIPTRSPPRASTASTCPSLPQRRTGR